MAGSKDSGSKSSFRLGVLISGSGSNLQGIIDSLHRGPEGIEVALVISDNPGAYGLERARTADIPAAVFPLEDYGGRPEHDIAMADELDRHGADLVVCAGYMRVVTPAFLKRFPRRVINLHPALLPAFPGATPIEDAMAYGVRVTGVTVHFVDDGIDTGPVILQQSVDIEYNDTVEKLRERIHEVEHRLLPEAIRLIAAGRVRFPEANSRRVVIE